MVSRILLVFLLFLVLSGFRGPDPEIIKFDKLKDLVEQVPEKKIYVINFWATWCKPCIKELPYFEALNKKYDNVEVYLISLDIPEETASKVKPFLLKRNIQSKVLVLDETDHNAWINQVTDEWSGAIPATMIIDGSSKQRTFHEGELSESELNSLVAPFIN